MIYWQDYYSTGVAQLDEQHKRLFIFCNDLDGILKFRDVAPEFLKIAVKFLEDYVEKHFGQEETCMHRYACPVGEKNLIAHRKFIEAYKIFEEKLNREEEVYGTLQELHQFLEGWLVEHICKIDTQLKPCVHS